MVCFSPRRYQLRFNGLNSRLRTVQEVGGEIDTEIPIPCSLPLLIDKIRDVFRLQLV